MDQPDFIAGTFSTKWLETFLEGLKKVEAAAGREAGD
jgi:hypothetical protein